jgi:hypothetical protein
VRGRRIDPLIVSVLYILYPAEKKLNCFLGVLYGEEFINVRASGVDKHAYILNRHQYYIYSVYFLKLRQLRTLTVENICVPCCD